MQVSDELYAMNSLRMKREGDPQRYTVINKFMTPRIRTSDDLSVHLGLCVELCFVTRLAQKNFGELFQCVSVGRSEFAPLKVPDDG